MHLKLKSIRNGHSLLLIKASVIVFISWILSKYVITAYFPKNILGFHNVAEITCLTIALATFFLIWFTYEQNSAENHILGFGFLAISLFQYMHIITFSTSSDYTLWYFLIARILEIGIMFLIISKKLKGNTICKRTGLYITIALSAILWFSVWINRYNLPTVYFSTGYFSFRFIVEIILTALTLTCFFILVRKGKHEFVIYDFLFQSLVLMASISLCFIIMGKNPTSYLNIMAHLIRVGYYVLLFIGIFGKAVIYPYEKLEEILNHLPLGVVTYDRERRLTFANKTAEEIFGISFRDWYARSDQEINDNFYLNAETHYIRKLSGKNRVLTNEIHTLKNPWGENKTIIVNAYWLKNGGYQAIYQEAKKAQALENMLLQTQTILNAINNFIVLLDNKQRIIMCNKTVGEIVGRKSGELVGLNILEFIKTTRFSDETTALNVLSGKTNCDFPLEISIVSQDGSIKDFLLHIDTVLNIDWEIIGTIGVGTDITELNKEKEERQQKEKLALLGQMATGIVHEIRNPLTAIRGFSALIGANPCSEKIAEYTGYIEEEVAGLNKIVTDYLTFAKPKPVLLNELCLNDLVQAMKPILDSHSLLHEINISYLFHEEAICINADEGQIKQVILNIAKNAVDVLNDVHSPEIKISTLYHNHRNETSLSIYNNGKALTEEEKKKIGTPFYTTKAKGTGLGLSICHQIMTEHNGRIDIKSEQGFGTVFELVFPAVKKTKVVNSLQLNSQLFA